MKLRRKLVSVSGNGPLTPPTLASEAAVVDAGFRIGLAVFLFRKLNRPKSDGGLAAVGMMLGVAA